MVADAQIREAMMLSSDSLAEHSKLVQGVCRGSRRPRCCISGCHSERRKATQWLAADSRHSCSAEEVLTASRKV